jgi:hypothetical protein
LGSSKRDQIVEVNLLGEDFKIIRMGTNGDYKKAQEILEELDGQVDAIGLGGIDIYLYSKNKQYVLKYGMKLKKLVKTTPVVDGSGLKNSLEKRVIELLQEDYRFVFSGKNCLMVCAMDRFGMATSLVKAKCKMIFGDKIFALGLDDEIHTLEELEKQADRLLPEIAKMPISMIYPVGEKQDTYAELKEMHIRCYNQADIIAGDYHYIRRFIPTRLDGRDIITNTVTPKDIEILKEKGVRYLVTTTPEFGGRSFGTNVLEAILISILKKPWEEIAEADYLGLIGKLQLKPRIEELNPNSVKMPITI